MLQVFDMPAAVRFYRDVLGFEVVSTSPRDGDQFDWGLLRLGDAEVMLNTAYEQPDRPAGPDASRAAAHADTTLYFGCPDVHAAYRHLKSHGIDVKPSNPRAPFVYYHELSDTADTLSEEAMERMARTVFETVKNLEGTVKH